MKKAILLPAFLCSSLIVISQPAKDYAVQATATVETSPPKITLHWPTANANSFLIYKKSIDDPTFGAPYANLSGTETFFEDTAVSVGEYYEYQIRQSMGSYTAYGAIVSGIEVSPIENRGTLILLVDTTHADTLSSELETLEKDFITDGWLVIRYDVSPNETAANTRNIIINEYNNNPEHVKAVFIVGHVPVPYSGELNPDGHANHIGAWPCDPFYGEMNGNWTDVSINNTSASQSRNHNVPGDGKFDQSIIPTDVELQVGRVDFYNMPKFTQPESELLRQYLNKNHDYRTKQFTAEPRALIDDNFGGFGGEAFAASAWKSFAPMVGPDSIFASDYFNTMDSASYLWSYGCGGGSYTSANGIGNTDDFVATPLQSVFTCLFGSYFGDWDSKNNFLRAALANGTTLTNAWSGRPHWHFHHMAMGLNIGYSAWWAYNSNNYAINFGEHWVHIGLMGDPTLRLHTIAPPGKLEAEENNTFVDLTWQASTDNVLGYYVYRRENLTDTFKRISPNIVPGTNFTDTDFENAGTFYYMVRAVKLEETPSGSYFNLSQGDCDSITTIATGIYDNQLNIQARIYPNPTNGIFIIKFNHTIHTEIGVYSSLGQLINSIKSSGHTTKIDLSEMKKGTYYLKIRNNDLSQYIGSIIKTN